MLHDDDDAVHCATTLKEHINEHIAMSKNSQIRNIGYNYYQC